MKHLDPYLPASELGLSEKNRQILIGVAKDLAEENIPEEKWGMRNWSTCICGQMNRRGAGLDQWMQNGRINRLFSGYGIGQVRYSPNPTQKEAGQAAYNFLTTGDPHWDEVLK
jgi:hypothetical protein